MTQSIEARVTALEATVAALRAALVGPAPKAAPALVAAAPRPPPPAGEIASDDLLSKPWADFEVRKDPPKWNGLPLAPVRVSQCPEDYLLNLAGFLDWKAAKGREEDLPRLNNKGRPWYESDELNAKLARGWAARAKAAGHATAVDPRQTELPKTGAIGPQFDDESEPLPF